jgi:hypothetical protein
MLIRSQSVRARVEMQPRAAARGGRAGTLRTDRLVGIVLAIYLAPALLLVLLVGGIGMLVLAAARAITSFVRRRETWPPEERLKAEG